MKMTSRRENDVGVSSNVCFHCMMFERVAWSVSPRMTVALEAQRYHLMKRHHPHLNVSCATFAISPPCCKCASARAGSVTKPVLDSEGPRMPVITRSINKVDVREQSDGYEQEISGRSDVMCGEPGVCQEEIS